MGNHPIRKLVALFLALVLTFSISFSDASITEVQAATDSGTWGKNIAWTYENGTLTVSGKGKMKDSPYRWEGFSQIFTSMICSKHMGEIKKVVISEGITEIGAYNFFRWYTDLRTVVLPSTLKKIGAYAFDAAKVHDGDPYYKIETVKFSKGLKVIDQGAFGHCNKLKKVTFPSTLTQIGDFAFFNCKNLKSLDFPASVKSIGDTAFAGCDKVTAIKVRNKNCNIFIDYGGFTFPSQATIYGYRGSTAEQYAKKYNRNFKVLPAPAKVKVKNVSITNAPGSLKAGKSIKLKAKIAPTSATNKKLAWSSSNPKYATVNQSGKVTAKSAGKGKVVRITAKAKDGSKKKHTVKIKIT